MAPIQEKWRIHIGRKIHIHVHVQLQMRSIPFFHAGRVSSSYSLYVVAGRLNQQNKLCIRDK